MVLLAHDNVQELIQQCALLRTKLGGFAAVSSEHGIKMRDGAGRTIEHFGYVDGRSQPLFFRNDVNKDSLNGRAPKQWDPSAGPSLVLVKDPLGVSDADCGTYYVFRKLEQNVKGFRQHVEVLADVLHLTGPARELAGALVIGRFLDGTPVALHPQATGRGIPSNDFVYANIDQDGNRCPFAAHIRKTNPRGDANGETPDEQRSHRMARRGMPYGDPTPPDDNVNALPRTGVGLLFQCYQADLAQQFEFVQQAWANNDALAKPGTGKDPVVGQSANGSFPSLKFPKQWGDPGRTPFRFHSFVTLKGGEYFFVPSLTFLKNLK
jgi:Dyp-type peroxidase family